MSVHDVLGTRVILGGSRTLPARDNDNLELMEGCRYTPAELMRWVRREKERLSRAAAEDPHLFECPDHRRDWMLTLGIEKLTLWKCYGVWGA